MSSTKRDRRDLARKFVYDYLLTHPCVICGEDNPAALEFDHIDPAKKRGAISRLVAAGVPLPLLSREFKNTQVLCCNCHRKKTAKEQGWYSDLK